MIIAIDGVGAKYGGAASVLTSMTEAALRSSAIDRVVVFGSARQVRQFALPAHDRLRDVEVRYADSGPLGRIAWHEVGLSRAARRAGVTVALCLGGGGHLGRSLPAVNLIQQSQPFLPEALRTLSPAGRLRMAAIRASMARSCRAARMVLVQTGTMRAAVASTFGIDPSRIVVVEPAPDVVPPRKGALELASMRVAPVGRRLLYVGHDAPYKNLGVLPEAVATLRRSMPGVQLFATIRFDHPIARTQGIVPLGHLPPAVVAEAYGLASALVMPSLAETVGLPLLEAGAAGLPILAADRHYAREVCGGSALYFDPISPVDLAEKAMKLLLDVELRKTLSMRGQALVARKTAAKPYDRIISLVVETALSSAGSPQVEHSP